MIFLSDLKVLIDHFKQYSFIHQMYNVVIPSAISF